MTELEQSDSRSGIAIIIVLGMLGVLMVLAVAFAIAMRTESAAAGNYAEVAKSRAMVHTALARALADLDQDLASSPSGAGYPSRWSLQAMDTNMANAVHLYIGEATTLLPQGIYETAAKLPSPGLNNGGGESVDDPNASWNPGSLAGFGIQSIGGAEGVVENNAEKALTADISVGSNYRLYDPAVPLWSRVENGRVAYLIVNLSGLLDGQFVGDEDTARGNGSSLVEIDVSQLSDVGASTMETLVDARDPANPFRSLYDLSLYGGFNGSMQNWSAYSRYPTQQGGFTNIALSDSPENLKLAFAEMAKQYYPNPPDQVLAAEALYNNLVDYEDADSIPGSALGGSTDGPWVEAVPMISEVFVTNTIALTTTGDLAPFPQSKIFAYIEYAYPFAHDPDAGPFRINYTVEHIPGPNTPAGFLPAAPISGSKYPINPTPADSYVVTTPLQPAVLQSQPNPTNFQYTVRVWAEVRDNDDNLVDSIPTNSFQVSVANLQPSEPVKNIGVGADVIDPVYNWHSKHWQESAMYPYAESRGDQNHETDLFFSINSAVSDVPPALAVKNAAMETVGELGCLYWPGAHWVAIPYYQLYYSSSLGGQMLMHVSPWLWRSVRLYDHGDGIWDRALDYLTVSAPLVGANGPYVPGLVNPNSEVQEALAAVFNQMRIDDYPGETNVATVLDWSTGSPNAMNLAAAIQDVTYTNVLAMTSELGRGDVMNAISNALFATDPNPSEVRKEALFRNAGSLFHTRQNLFLILLAGQTANDPSTFGPPFGVPRTDQRALAVVWRDPVADSNGRHPCFVRWFTWLEK